MALDTDEQHDDTAVIEQATDEQQGDPLQEGAAVAVEGDGDTPADQVAEPADEVVITLGDEPADADEEDAKNPVIRDIRKAQRDAVRALRQAEREKAALADEVARLKGGGQQETALGPRPKLSDPAIDFDEDKLDSALTDWHAKKQADDARKAQQADQARKSQEAWDARRNTYETAKKALKVPDFEDAEDSVRESLSVVQQGVILNGCESPELMVYALGKNPKKAKELAAIADPVKFAFAVAKLETQLKVTPRKTAPAPESVVRSGMPGAVAVGGAQLAKLQADAQRTGDYSEYFAAKRRLKPKD